MADGVAWRLRAAGLRAATVTLKLRDSSFRTITRQTTLEVPSDLTEPIYDAAIALLRRELHGQRIRLVGVTASNFREREQLAMFGGGDPRRHATAAALDTIRRKYGSKAVTRARLVRAALPEPFERDPMTAVEHRGAARRGRGSEAPLDIVEQANEPVFDDSLGDTDGTEDLDADA